MLLNEVLFKIHLDLKEHIQYGKWRVVLRKRYSISPVVGIHLAKNVGNANLYLYLSGVFEN